MHVALQNLHPHEQDSHEDECSHKFSHPVRLHYGVLVFQLIAWSKRETAIDQWGWVSKEIWSPQALRLDSERMDDMAQV